MDATLAELRKMLRLLESTRLRAIPLIDTAQDLAERRIIGELLAERHHTQVILANLGEGVVELDDRKRVVYVNPAALRLLQVPEAEVIGSPGARLFGAANAAILEQGVREVLAAAEGHPLRMELVHGQRIVGITLTVVPRPDSPPGILFVLRDLTELTRRVRNLAAVAAGGRQILATLDLTTVLRQIVTRTAGLLAADRCALFQVEGTGAHLRLRCVQAHGLSEGYVRALDFAPGEAVVGKAIERRRHVATADISQEPALRLRPALRAQLEAEDIGAILAVPMVVADAAVGALAVYRPAGHHFTSEEVELVTGLAAAAAIALENARLYGEVQRYSQDLERKLGGPQRTL